MTKGLDISALSEMNRKYRSRELPPLPDEERSARRPIPSPVVVSTHPDAQTGFVSSPYFFCFIGYDKFRGWAAKQKLVCVHVDLVVSFLSTFIDEFCLLGNFRWCQEETFGTSISFDVVPCDFFCHDQH